MAHQDEDCANAASKKKLAEDEKHVSDASKSQYKTGYKFNSLHYASSPEMVKCFISSGIDVNIKNYQTGETPLQTVIRLNQSPDVVRELLKAGATIEVRNKYTLNTPLNHATQIPECSPETIRALLEYGADVNAVNIQNNTSLHSACQCFKGDFRIVELLLKAGSPVNIKNSREETPLHVALQNPYCTGVLVLKLLQYNSVVTIKILEMTVGNEAYDYLNIIQVMMQCMCTMSVSMWFNVMKHLLLCIRTEQKLEDILRVMIKYSFLKCNRPYSLRVKILPIFNYLRNGTLLLFIPHVPANRQKYLAKHGSFLKSIADSLESFCRECILEIAGMKKEMLKTNISLYNFIASHTSKVCLEEKLVNILKEDTFPIYSDIILSKIKRAAILDKLYQQQVYCLAEHENVTRWISLDALSVSNIAKYLSVNEIKNLVDAFCNPADKEYYVWDDLVEIDACLSKKSQVSKQKSLSVDEKS